MSTPLQDGYQLLYTNSTVSSSSHPRQPGTPSSHIGHSLSPAITSGTERLLALFEEDVARIKAEHRKKMDDLAARFDEFRYFTAREQLKLVDRIYLLEAELAARGVDIPPSERGSYVPVQRDGGQPEQAATSRMDILDVETIHLVRDLARLVKGTELTTRTPRGIENITLDVNYVPELFLPALAQYLASHRKALRDLQEKCCAVERERDSLRESHIKETMSVAPNPPLRPTHRSSLVDLGAFFIPATSRHEAREVKSNSLLGAVSSFTSGDIPKRPQM